MSAGDESPAALSATQVDDSTPDPFGMTRQEGAEAARSRQAFEPLACGAKLGRYVVMAQLGRGGMGVVYAAYDPELDRKVAVKLLGGDTAKLAEERLQREARAMAQLAHPNVVTVYDVGTLADRLWIAMEFIDGLTLADWIRARPRNWREVLVMFLAAGEGLVAAHRAGIVHRDFKPDNVMIGADGRARVMDFGLARAGALESSQSGSYESGEPSDVASSVGAITRAGSLVGTPRYMAPEQWEGAPVDARTDEFAFCMALWEALYGRLPMAGDTLAAQALAVTTGRFVPAPTRTRVPGWVRKACRRGLAVDPDQRYGSMIELLRALRRDPAPRRRALFGAAVVAALGGGAWVDAELEATRRDTACLAAATGLDAVWNEPIRVEIRDAILASGSPHADTTFERSMPWLDLFQQRWSATAEATCRAATIAGELPPERAWHIAACLDEGRAEFGQWIDELRRGQRSLVRSAVTVSSSLSDPRSCSAEARLSDHEPGAWAARAELTDMRRELRRAAVLRRAHQYAPAAAMTSAIEHRAAALGAPIVLAMARHEAGMIAHTRGDVKAARLHFESAYYTAGAAAADELAIDAAKWLAFIIGYELGQIELGLVWGRLAEMTLDRMHVGAVDLRRANLDSDLGTIDLQRGDLDAALRRFSRSVAVLEQLLGVDHPEIIPVLNNLGTAHHARGEYVEATAILTRVVELEAKNLGPEHSNVALARGNLSAILMARGELEAARAGFEWTAEVLERTRGPQHPDVAAALLNLSLAESNLGAHESALGHALRAASIREVAYDADSDLLAATLSSVGDLHQRLGQHAAALAAHRRALVIYEHNHGPAYPSLSDPLCGIAAVRLAEGALDEARAYYMRALGIDEAEPEPAAVRALVGLGDIALARKDYAAARELFGRALAIDERAHGHDHPTLTRALRGVGEAQIGLGEASAAVATLARALQLHEATAFAPVEAAVTRFALARALWSVGAERSRAVAEATAARDALVGAGDKARVRLTEVDAWLSKRPRRP